VPYLRFFANFGGRKGARLTNDFRELAVTGRVKPLKGEKGHGDTAANEEFAALSGDKPRVLGKTHSWVFYRTIGRSGEEESR
jgi:hypothetical protein